MLDILIFKRDNSDIADFYANLTLSLLKSYSSVKVDVLTANDIPISKSDFCNYVSKNKISKDTAACIVFGGDGSVASVYRLCAFMAESNSNFSPVIVGINAGNRGFLTPFDFKHDNLKFNLFLKTFSNLIEKSDCISSSTLIDKISEQSDLFNLEARYLAKALISNTDDSFYAANEFVISDYRSGVMLDFEWTVNDVPVCNFKADGSIVGTPTGSTAYTSSINGAIINPTDSTILQLCAIAPLSLSLRPLIVGKSSLVSIKANLNSKNRPLIKVDGLDFEPSVLDTLILNVTVSKTPIYILTPSDFNFYHSVSEKLNWGR